MRLERIFYAFCIPGEFELRLRQSARTREVDFVAETGGRLELFEAKWTELPSPDDAVNLQFVRRVVGKSRIAGSAVVCRAANSFTLPNGFRALPVPKLV